MANQDPTVLMASTASKDRRDPQESRANVALRVLLAPPALRVLQVHRGPL
ncbi:hypothetical protein [Nocardiopsis eucommiae]